MKLRTVAAVALLALAAATGSGGAQSTAVINLINLPADNSAEVYYAQDLGFFKEAGLDVRITSMTNSGAIVAALAGGAADIGNSVIGSAAQARSKGIAVKFIAPAGLYEDANYTSALVVPKDSPIRSAADLNGKTIAVSGLNDLTYYGTRAWLDKHGGNSGSVKYVELPFPAMAAALTAHRVDAAYDVDPFLTATSDATRILGLAAGAVAPRFQATGWIVTDSWLQTHADIALRFAAVMRRTALWGNTHHKESALILEKYLHVDPAVADRMHRVNYATTLEPRLVQPPIDIAVKYGGGQTMSADELIWAPAK